MSSETDKKIDTYIGFARCSHSLFVGRLLEEQLSLKKVKLLVLLPGCPEKVRRDYLRIKESQPKLDLIDYQGEMNLALSCGFTDLNAFGITDVHLATPLSQLLRKED